MTTIATDGKSMAGDGLVVSHDIIVDRSRVKVWRTSNGSLVGCAGAAEQAAIFIAWREGGRRPVIKSPFEALVLSPSGTTTYHCDRDLDGVETELPAAIGSGMEAALAAMDAGASPVRAIEIAGNRNPFTGGRATVLTLGEFNG